MSDRVLRRVPMNDVPFKINPVSEGAGGKPLSVPDAREEARMILSKARLDSERLRREAEREILTRRANLEAEVQAAVDAAREEAYREGLTRAEEETRAAVEETLSRLGGLLEDCRAELVRNLRDQERRIMELAVAVAEKIVRGSQVLNPSMVLRVTQDAIERATEKEEVTLRLNPADMEMIQKHLPDLRDRFHSIRTIHLEEDSRISPGGCIVETCSGYVDGTVEGQIEEIRRELGIEE